jgi:hypothetical protein
VNISRTILTQFEGYQGAITDAVRWTIWSAHKI